MDWATLFIDYMNQGWAGEQRRVTDGKRVNTEKINIYLKLGRFLFILYIQDTSEDIQ